MTISSGRRVALILISAAFLAVAIFMLVRNHSLQSDAGSWVAARGEVVSTGIERKRHRGPDGYAPQIRYRYQVDGRTYFSDRVWLAAPAEWSSHDGAVEFLAAYPVGGEVELFHDPADPQRSALIRETPNNILWIMCGLFGLAGIISMSFFWKRTGAGWRPLRSGRP